VGVIKRKLLALILFLSKKLGIGLTSRKNLERLKKESNEFSICRQNLNKSQFDLKFFHALYYYGFEKAKIEILFNLLDVSKSQLRQDLLVLITSNFKKNGYFVDFGATDGFNLSNTLLLEKKFNWNGILAEPAKAWHEKLRYNRNSIIDTRAVWKETGETLIFNEVKEYELSTIDEFSNNDLHAEKRSFGSKYVVHSVSLLDLLIDNDAPPIIDYLSIDTEGSELQILSNFDFSKYKFRIITCEHNYTINRDAIHDILISNGYKRILESVSDFDDWYILIA